MSNFLKETTFQRLAPCTHTRRHYDIQNIDTQQKGLICATQHKWHSVYSVSSVIMLSVAII